MKTKSLYLIQTPSPLKEEIEINEENLSKPTPIEEQNPNPPNTNIPQPLKVDVHVGLFNWISLFVSLVIPILAVYITYLLTKGSSDSQIEILKEQLKTQQSNQKISRTIDFLKEWDNEPLRTDRTKAYQTFVKDKNNLEPDGTPKYIKELYDVPNIQKSEFTAMFRIDNFFKRINILAVREQIDTEMAYESLHIHYKTWVDEYFQYQYKIIQEKSENDTLGSGGWKESFGIYGWLYDDKPKVEDNDTDKSMQEKLWQWLKSLKWPF